MQDAYNQYREKGFEILSINLDSNSAAVQDFIDRFEYNFTVLEGNIDVATEYMVRFVPKTLFLDADGIIRYEHVGPLEYQEISNIINEIGLP